MDTQHFQDITVDFRDAVLTVSNSRIRRVIDFSQGYPKTQSFEVDGIGICEPSAAYDFHLVGFPDPGNGRLKCDFHLTCVKCNKLELPDGEGLKVTVSATESVRRLRLSFNYYIYPNLPVIATNVEFSSAVIPHLTWLPRVTLDFKEECGSDTIVDSLRLTSFTPDKAVEFKMRTDNHNDLVLEHPAEAGKPCTGNILFAKQTDGDVVAFFLQEAPPSEERRAHSPWDFLLGDDGTISSLGSGVIEEDIVPERRLITNRAVFGVASDGDAEALIKQYQARRRPVSMGMGNIITVNPCGNGSFIKLVSEPFLVSEIKAAATLNADSYQVDDGYEQGNLGDLSVQNRPLDKSFWVINKNLLPDGFNPLVKASDDGGIVLSLWFAPTTSRAYEDWRESADVLLGFYREYGIKCFKIDGAIFSSYQAEENFGRLLKTIYEESNGEITVNLDVTNGTRGGLFKYVEYGLVFLENRYCCHPWVRCPYSPESTLSNLWRLSRYCRIQTLQIEVPSPDNLNEQCYLDRNLPLPTEYAMDYWAMIPLFASPLLWLAPSQIKPQTAKTIAKTMKLQRQYRDNWRNAVISPVGDAPSGKSICGFHADTGWLLVFRELNAPDSAKLSLPAFTTAECIYSTADATLEAGGTVRLAAPGSAALFRLG